jgi:hypothetical protein
MKVRCKSAWLLHFGAALRFAYVRSGIVDFRREDASATNCQGIAAG